MPTLKHKSPFLKSNGSLGINQYFACSHGWSLSYCQSLTAPRSTQLGKYFSTLPWLRFCLSFHFIHPPVVLFFSFPSIHLSNHWPFKGARLILKPKPISTSSCCSLFSYSAVVDQKLFHIHISSQFTSHHHRPMPTETLLLNFIHI